MQLRPYQETCRQNIQNGWRKGLKKILVTAPTGAGKTVIFCDLARRTIERKKKVMIFTNRTELLTQAGGSLSKIGISSFKIQAGADYISNTHKVFVAMAQTIRNRLDKKHWRGFLSTIDLFIIDECHLQEFNFLFEDETLFKDKYVLGFTATPKRSGKMRQLALDYEDIIETVSVRKLIEDGYLVDCDYYGCSIPDLSKVGFDKMKGDYQEKQLFQAFNSAKLYAGVVRNWKTICNGSKTLVFCCNIEHSIRTCQEFVDNGISAKFVVSGVSKPKYPTKITDGTMAVYEEKRDIYSLYCHAFQTMSGKRDDIFEQFAKGEFQVLVNAGIATTGYDCPSIETIIINRATMSESLWLQMLGRGSRIFEGKTHFNILDFGDNAKRLGTYSQDRNWQLWHEESKGGGVAPIKRCGFESSGAKIYADNNPKRMDMFCKEKLDGCGRYIHAGLTICPFCGFKYVQKVLKEVNLETIFFNENINSFERAKPISQMNATELTDYCRQKKHKQAWLWRQLYTRFGMQSIDSQPWSEEVKNRAKKYVNEYCIIKNNF